jgi:hypothetical protein
MSDRSIAISMGGVAWDHLRYTSPGSLFDDELHEWGYEPEWAGPEFVKECREAAKNPIEILSAGEGKHLVVLLFPSCHHAEAVLNKLEKEGHLRAFTGFESQIREEGRCFLAAAAKGFEQLRKQAIKEER